MLVTAVLTYTLGIQGVNLKWPEELRLLDRQQIREKLQAFKNSGGLKSFDLDAPVTAHLTTTVMATHLFLPADTPHYLDRKPIGSGVVRRLRTVAIMIDQFKYVTTVSHKWKGFSGCAEGLTNAVLPEAGERRDQRFDGEQSPHPSCWCGLHQLQRNRTTPILSAIYGQGAFNLRAYSHALLNAIQGFCRFESPVPNDFGWEILR